jgi:hypothetical protein
MGTLEIIKRNGEKIRLFSKEPFCTLKSAAQNSSLMGDDNVQLSIVSSELLNLGKGDKIIVEGEEYTIRTKVNREMLSGNHYVHDATFYGVMYELMKSLYRNTDANGKSSKSTFDLTYNIRDFVKVLIYNVSRDYPGLWAFDEANCPDTEPRTISFARNNCLQVLQMLCSDREFDLEFLITQKDGVRTIHIGKFGAKVVPPGGNAFFEWGKGNGLYKLKEQKVDDKTIITRLWVEGGTTNIRSDYRDYSERLQLPFPVRLNKKEHKLWDGTIVPPQSEYIGISDDNKRYLEDGDLRDALGSDEDAVTYDDIFPKRTGTVTALVADDINSFIDDTMDFDLNEKDDKGTKYLINEVSAKITFISGKLAGQQFELAQKGGYDHATKRFTLIPFTDNRGLTIPTTESEAYRITEGDTYKITDIHLPKSYEDDAEEDLWYAGYNEFKPRTQARAQYQLTFERSYFLNALPSDSETTVFHVGNYVPVKDERFGIEKNIRIQKVTKNLLVEHDYTLTLSDITAISPITQTVVDVGRHETIIENNRLRDLTKARRGWRTTEELRTMVYDTDGYFDPENIKPNSIDTNMLTVGSKSQQFVLIDVILQANVNGISNRFDASAGVLAHLTIDDEIIKHWNMAAGSFTLSSPKGYYVFAKCSKKSTDGIWYVTQEQLKVEPTEDPNNYYFQVGILGSVHSDDDFRDFTTTYGFTRINGNTITTGKIITSDKECYLDLDGNKFRIGDSSSSIDWNVTAKRQLTLHNVRLLSDSGDTSHIGVFRGTYNPKYVYYAGDEVAYTVIGETCTYRYTNPTPSMGNLPTNSVYWSVVAKGSTGDKGESGLSVFYTYNDSETKPATPTGDGSTGGWHRTSSENVVWMSIKNAKTDAEGAWGIPFRVRGADGTSINIKGSKENVSQLPTVGNSEGDAYLIGGNLYIWDGTNWKDVGAIKGEDGKSSYLHKKYSDDGGKTFTAGNGETPGRWLGLYVDMIPTDSDKPSAYKWSDTKGQDGTPGLPGEDGRTPYFHIKYSDNGGMSFTANNGEEPGDYIGQYTDYVQKDSDNPMDYTWALIKGESGTSGTDAGAGEYYEYRYAKNGSTLVPPDLDVNSSNPTGWSTEMPKVGALEYIWCTMAKKSGLADRTKFHLPIEANDTSSIADISGNGYNGVLGGGTVVKDGTRYALNLSGGMESCIPYDLPFGESFTLCFWMKSDQNQVKWMLNGYNGRHYVEKSIVITPNTWFHLAFRFNDRTVTVFKNGEQLHSGSVNIMAVGFAIYDDDVFGSAVYFDDVRLLMGALPVNDIASVMNGKADLMIQKWSTPIRVNPYDGKDGKPGDKGEKGDSPVLVYRGIYDSSKTYYGNSKRLDAVKYNNQYYIARIDAGTFTGFVPTNTGKWDTFGAQFETIATNLLLAEGANIGDWFTKGGKIVSTMDDGNKIELDASMARIYIESSRSGGDYALVDFGAKMTIDANRGIFETRAKNAPSYSNAVSYMSPTGIFSNMAGTDGMPASSGYTHRGAIVGLGFANVPASTWGVNVEDTIVAGVYGRASNSGTAPAFGGFFYDLFAGGLIFGRKCITGTSNNTWYLNREDTVVIGYTSAASVVYLPASPKEGQVIFVKQWWRGHMRFRPRSGYLIYDDTSVNDYYDFGEGQGGMFVYTVGYVDGVKKQAWLVSRWKY